MKTIKAWAVVDKDGVMADIPHPTHFHTYMKAVLDSQEDAKKVAWHGERVVRVTITVEDE